jgi:hypothetical protein
MRLITTPAYIRLTAFRTDGGSGGLDASGSCAFIGYGSYISFSLRTKRRQEQTILRRCVALYPRYRGAEYAISTTATTSVSIPVTPVSHIALIPSSDPVKSQATAP